MAATFLLVWRAVPQPDVGRSTGRLTIGSALRSYAALLRSSAILAAVATFAHHVPRQLAVRDLPADLARGHRRRHAGQVAALFFVGGVANVLAGPRAGRLSDRIGRKRSSSRPAWAFSVHAHHPDVGRPQRRLGVRPLRLIMALMAVADGPFQALLTQLVPAERRGSLMSLTVGNGTARLRPRRRPRRLHIRTQWIPQQQRPRIGLPPAHGPHHLAHAAGTGRARLRAGRCREYPHPRRFRPPARIRHRLTAFAARPA
jgi:hypothetical protein